jgi:hypothetical protein
LGSVGCLLGGIESKVRTSQVEPFVDKRLIAGDARLATPARLMTMLAGVTIVAAAAAMVTATAVSVEHQSGPGLGLG